MVSEANLEWLRERGSRYIVGTPKSQLRRFERELAGGEWAEVREGLEVKTCRAAKGCETFILCRSEYRATKERTMRRRFEKRIETGLEKTRASCRSRRQQLGPIERRLGRLLGQNTRAAAIFDVEVAGGEDGGSQLNWSKKTEHREWAVLSEGCYIVRSNVDDWSGEELWRA